jgi:hypothetical protein
MTPKEKALELIDRFSNHTFNVEKETEDNFESAKQCALICCNEVLGYMGADRGTEFWQKVKQELNKL